MRPELRRAYISVLDEGCEDGLGNVFGAEKLVEVWCQMGDFLRPCKRLRWERVYKAAMLDGLVL